MNAIVIDLVEYSFFPSGAAAAAGLGVSIKQEWVFFLRFFLAHYRINVSIAPVSGLPC